MKRFAILAVLLLAPAAQATDAVIRVGSKAFTENVILGEIAVKSIEAKGGTASHQSELGGTQIVWKALLRGDVDLYADYTGTLFQEQFVDKKLTSLDALAKELDALGIGMTQPLGFNNTYAIGIKRAVAEKHGIRRISDLAKQPQLKLGFSNEFMNRADGWPALRDRYELPHKDVTALEHEMAYRAIESDTIHVTDLYSTDAEIEYYDLVALEDDRQLFPQYMALFLYRKDALTRFPALADVLRSFEGALDDETMIGLNAEAKIRKVSEKDVAAGFVASRAAVGAKAAEASTRPEWVDRFLRNTMHHLALVFIPLVLCILVGIPLGVVASHKPGFARVILSVAGVVQTIPSLALIVFMIPLLGIGHPPALVALFLYGLLPIVRNTYTGIQDIPPHLVESANALGLSRMTRLFRVELPMASRSILGGIKISAVISVGTATLGAIIGAGGYGEPIMMGIRRDDVSLILQGAIPAAALALLVQGVFGLAERYVVPTGLRLKPSA